MNTLYSTTNISEKNKILYNFSRCKSSEEKYLYLIELGQKMPIFPSAMRVQKNIVYGCQSRVWIVVKIDEFGKIQLYGDSDASIVKGLISITFIVYQKLRPKDVVELDVRPFFQELKLSKYLTFFRAHGLETIVTAIRKKSFDLININ